jgi:hypothetical protein
MDNAVTRICRTGVDSEDDHGKRILRSGPDASIADWTAKCRYAL